MILTWLSCAPVQAQGEKARRWRSWNKETAFPWEKQVELQLCNTLNRAIWLVHTWTLMHEGEERINLWYHSMYACPSILILPERSKKKHAPAKVLCLGDCLSKKTTKKSWRSCCISRHSSERPRVGAGRRRRYGWMTWSEGAKRWTRSTRLCSRRSFLSARKSSN